MIFTSNWRASSRTLNPSCCNSSLRFIGIGLSPAPQGVFILSVVFAKIPD